MKAAEGAATMAYVVTYVPMYGDLEGYEVRKEASSLEVAVVLARGLGTTGRNLFVEEVQDASGEVVVSDRR